MTVRYLNGKFTAQQTTGVQRAAACLVGALDELLARGEAVPGRWVLLCPPGAKLPMLTHIEVRCGGPAGSLHRWEQLWLPWAARDGQLVNLAGSAPWFGRRQVVTIHDAAVWDHPGAYTRGFVAWYRLLFRRLAASAQCLITVSEFSRARLQACLAPQVPLAVVPNGCDHLDAVVPDDAFVDRLGLARRPFLLAVASANPTKNLERLVRAFGVMSAGRDLALVIAGGRNAKVFAGALAEPDPPGVLRPGPLGDAQLKALYGRAVALAFPSLYEGFGIPPLEAMRCGCPVVASTAASLPEVCADAALMVDPLSEAAIADALRRVLDEPLLHASLRERGLARAAGCTWQASARELLAALAAAGDRR
jgi:glycosyltransferase involved in cell wall biosynthesis